MEICNVHLFRVNCMPNLLVLLLSSVIVMSLPMKETIVDVMKKDTELCNKIEFLYESEYVKSCATLNYPVQFLNITEGTLDTYMCLGIYDTAYKICNYSDHVKMSFSVAEFNSYMKKFVPTETEWNEKKKFCKDHLQGFTPLYNKVEIYLGPLSEMLNSPHKCERTCFDLNDVFRPLCAVFAWIKSIDDNIKKLNVPVTNNNPVAPAIPKAPVDLQPSDKNVETELKETEKKITEEKGLKEQSYNKIKNATSNMPNEHTQPNTEKVESELEKSNKHETQKVISTTKSQDHNPRDKSKESTSNVKVETNADAPKTLDNVPSKDVNTEDAKEGNVEETDRKAEIEDPKTSTLSENTQDDVGNSDDETENLGVDTIQEPITGNQNENLQAPIEKNSYSNRSDGDSHFFTYFTVTTVACIACYIGYHNKQKILAIVLEGRRSRNSRGRRRPSTASYRKLDCTLEEAVTSQCNANVTHVIY